MGENAKTRTFAYPLEPLFERVRSPFERFLRRTTAGGIVLVGTTLIALTLAGLIGAHALHDFWGRPFAVTLGPRVSIGLTWHQLVNDGLMALFFLLVGLELKREMLVGELSSLRDAALPVIAALGGMVVPAVIYAAFNAGEPTASGWGIPMATDIAFAIGILVLLAWRVPKNLIVFLTALAIADDLGAVLVIAVFYTADLDLRALGGAGAVLVVLWLFNRAGIRRALPYGVAGILLWLALHASGVHATLAGILLAAMIPARPAHTPAEFERRITELHAAFRADRRDVDTPDDPLSNSRMASIAEAMERSAVAVQSPLHRIEHGLTPWVTFAIIPIFALANAGIDLTAIDWSGALSSRVTLGVASGLVVGKFVGVTLFCWLAVRFGIARLPNGVAWKHIAGAGWLAGIGFTMSLFITQLAFRDPRFVEDAKLGILLASAISAGVGLAWLAALAGDRSRPQR
ncbi:MAG TPA: Na+/H+ antiporter NhaA [Burkholderiales bacterium]|nr:Na+/H+ antiporter NhaA [Burkholderiales bacterium]